MAALFTTEAQETLFGVHVGTNMRRECLNLIRTKHVPQHGYLGRKAPRLAGNKNPISN